MNKIRSVQQPIINQYLFKSDTGESIGASSKIWVCWWQGEESMPLVVKACYESIKQHSGGHEVVLITTDNMCQYVSLPDHVIKKFDLGIISNTHMSDILRMYLLKEYGGIWVDITNFLTRRVDEFVDVTQQYWSCRHITKYNNVSRGLWTSYFVASGKGAFIPSYIYDSLVNWWREKDELVDYLHMDFVFKMGYDLLPEMKKTVDSIELSDIGTLRRVINKRYNKDEWEFYCQQAGFQKLTYKKNTDKYTPKGEKTHYAYLLEYYGIE